MDTSMSALVIAVRAEYRAAFLRGVAEGRLTPLVMPYAMLGTFIVPLLWLTIPHTRRPWLYQTRWLVAAFVVLFNLHITHTASSVNFAASYAVGLMSGWGTIMNLSFLIWSRPQFEAARVVRRPKKHPLEKSNGHHSSPVPEKALLGADGIRKRNPDAGSGKELALEKDSQLQIDAFENVWEPFPAEQSFLNRLGWVADLMCSFRGSGWNWSVSCIPRPVIPQEIRKDSAVDFSSMPQVSRKGYGYSSTEIGFIFNRLRIIATCYLLLDLLSIYMTMDPYFIIGPDGIYELPPHLERLPYILVVLYRQSFSLVAFLSAILGVFSFGDLVQHWFLKLFFPSRGQLWQFPSTFGSFSLIFDQGLAGWWGGFWHQTFRSHFLAPSTYMLKQGFVTKGTLVANSIGLLVPFVQSGFMHGSGSVSAIPQTKVWRAPLFFVLQAVGITVQDALRKALRPHVPHPPKALSQAANATFALVWLSFTATLFIDDLASTGLWMLEPVPFSVFRPLGLSEDNDWWRVEPDQSAKWYSGKHWWQSGFAV